MSDKDIFDYDDLDDEAFQRMVEDGFIQPEPGVGENTVFDDQFERRARELNRKPYSGSQKTTIVPDRKGPWSANNQLGIEQPFEESSNNAQTILKLDEWGFPEIWTVCLGMAPLSEFTGSGFDVTAVILFGAGGITQEVEIDWLCGSAISLPMNAVNVIAKYNLFSGEAQGEVPADLRLRVSLARGALPNARPTRTIVIQDAVTHIEIPPFAKEVTITPRELPLTFYAQNIDIDIATAPPEVGHSVLASYRPTQLLSFFNSVGPILGAPMRLPIPPYARTINFRDALLAPSPQVFTAQFLIGL